MQLKGLKNRYGYTLADKKLGGGGEGDVYEVTSHNGLVAKIYHPQYRTSERCKKIEAMANDANAGGFTLVSWPIDVLYDANGFCGFVMKKFSNREDLGLLLGDETISWDKRIVIAYNLCDIVAEIHRSGQCIGDMNPQNFGIDISQTLGCCAFDADSFHYIDKSISGNNTVYQCSVGVGFYLAPEIHRQLTVSGHNLASLNPNNSFSQDTDLFALAVLIFQLLFLGFHPFQAMRLPSYGSSTVVSKREKNIYNKMSPYFNPSEGITVPKYSPQVDIIPQSMQSMFRLAFIGPDNSRPKPEEWQRELLSILNSRKQCSKNKEHVYWGGLSQCPWCKSPAPAPDPTPTQTPGPKHIANPDPTPQQGSDKHGKATNKPWKTILGWFVAIIFMVELVMMIVDGFSQSSPASTPKSTPRPAITQSASSQATTPAPTISSGYVSKKYNWVDDLPSNVDQSDIGKVVDDWLAYPEYNSDLCAYEGNTVININAGEETRLALVRGEHKNCTVWINYKCYDGANISFRFADSGGGWGGHEVYGYFKADKKCTILVALRDEYGNIAHLVIYAK